MARKGFAFILALFIWLFLFTPALAASCDYTVNNVAGLLSAKNTIRSANNNMTKDIVVCLKGGNYYLEDIASLHCFKISIGGVE